jgi:hypothetical protein
MPRDAPIDMNGKIRICCAVFGLALFGLTGCETTEETPAVTTTTTTHTREVHATAPSATTETRVIETR